MSKTPIQLRDVSAAQELSAGGIVKLNKITVPNTTIVGRAKMVDLSNDLGVRMGIERIPVQQIMRVDGEAGPNGEPVWKPVNDKFDQIRFVGNFSNINNSAGQIGGYSSGAGVDYCEVTFYGTGLNILASDYDSTGRDLRATIDGGAEGGNLLATSLSAVINGRNYSQNIVVSVASGLSLGLHTIKLRNVTWMRISGFEILNESSSLNIAAGTSYVGASILKNLTATTSAYNSGFESGTLGTKGGHVVVYQKADGSIGKAVTPTDTAAAYLTSASHANEEVIRTYNWREFGAGRSDDFSTLSSSGTARAFTLDDGTTTLIASSNISSTTSPDALQLGAANAFITITFVGTGLDWTRKDNSTGTLVGGDVISLFVDGVAQGNINSVGATNLRVEKIVSGLAYGTHTVKISRSTAVTFSPAFTDFIVYGPKKPSVPAGAVELADYFVMGDFVANAVAGQDRIATGVLRKFAAREFVYSGTWGMDTNVAQGYIGNMQLWTGTPGSYAEYTFFGTGFDFRFQSFPTGYGSATMSINGITLTSANFSTASFGTVGLSTGFNSSSGVLSWVNSPATQGAGFKCSGLPLGKYTIKIAQATTQISVEALDIITPIHTPKMNGPFVVQNTLSVGSQGINDRRKFGSQIGRVLQSAQAVGVTSDPSTTSGPAVPMPEMVLSIYSTGGPVQVSCAATLRNSSVGQTGRLTLFVNGTATGKPIDITAPVANYKVPATASIIVNLQPGWHTIVGCFSAPGGGTTATDGDSRILTAIELQ